MVIALQKPVLGLSIDFGAIVLIKIILMPTKAMKMFEKCTIF